MANATERTIIEERIVAINGRVAGWKPEPDIRGTWTIVWNCLVTVFICTYTILCLNVPAPTDTKWDRIRRRLLWMLLAVMGPEIVLTYAAGQWSRAKQSVQRFHASGFHAWTMQLAFFADMGGFHLEAPDCDAFPLNAVQLHWLIADAQAVDYPRTTPDEIADKSKQDRLVKVITAVQIAYMVVQCTGRLVQGVAVTTLELNTLAIVVCSLMTSYTWLHKPADVCTPVRLRLRDGLTLRDVTRDQPWATTPLDFVDANGPGWAMNIQPFVGLPVLPIRRPLQRIPDCRFPMNPHGMQEYLLCFATLLFTGFHIVGWNVSFPSRAEQVLWRASSVLLFGVTAAFWLLETAASWVRLGRWQRLRRRKGHGGPAPEAEAEVEAEEKPRDMSTLPLPWEFWSIAPIALLYALARVFQVLEGFLELRDIDATAFVQVNWSMYIPHV